MKGLRLGLSLTGVTAVPLVDPLTLSPTAWYDPSDSSTIWQDTAGTTPAGIGDPVGRLDDKSGNGNHLTQGTSGLRPTRQSGYIDFDGAHWLGDAFTLTTALDRMSAIRQTSHSGGTAYIFDGWTADQVILWQIGASPGLEIYGGGASACRNTSAAVGTDVVITERFNGASSRLAVNNGAYATGDTGGVPGGGGGVTVGAKGAGASPGFWAAFRLYGLLITDGAWSDAEIAQIRTYLGSKISLTL